MTLLKLKLELDPNIPCCRFALECGVTWWKAITEHQDGHFKVELVAIQDQPGVIKFADVDINTLDIYEYVLSKAKLFGVHTDMYRIANADEMKGGCQYLFKWISD